MDLNSIIVEGFRIALQLTKMKEPEQNRIIDYDTLIFVISSILEQHYKLTGENLETAINQIKSMLEFTEEEKEKMTVMDNKMDCGEFIEEQDRISCDERIYPIKVILYAYWKLDNCKKVEKVNI